MYVLTYIGMTYGTEGYVSACIISLLLITLANYNFPSVLLLISTIFKAN